MHNESMIESVHRGRSGVRGRRALEFTAPTKGSEASLQANDFKIERTIEKVWGSWFDSFEELSLQPNGYYYLSIKSPGAHVMACIIEMGSVFYLEPQFGLTRFSTMGHFLGGVSKWYSSKWPTVTNSMMKIYRVSQAP